MATPLSIRCKAVYAAGIDTRALRLEECQSLDDPRGVPVPLCEGVARISTAEIYALRREAALLIRPLLSSPANDWASGVWRFHRLGSSASFRDAPRIEALLFSASDWSRSAPSAATTIDTLFAEANVRRRAAPDGGPRSLGLHFDIPAKPLARIGDCRASDLAMMDSLARGERAIFGLESFASDREFLQACANVLAMLPPSLRASISLAAGFTRPVSGALIQWIDGRVSPPSPGPLAARIFELGLSRSVSYPGQALFGERHAGEMARELLHDRRVSTDDFDDRARKCLARVFADAVEARSASSGPKAVRAWRSAVRTVVYLRRDITTELAADAALFVDRFMDRKGASCADEMQPVYRADRTIAMVRDAYSLAAQDAAAIADSISAVEEILELGKAVSSKLAWTPGLTALVRTTIAALRRTAIEMSPTDASINAGFLRAIASAPHCSKVLAGMIRAGDGSLRAAVQQALSISALLSHHLDAIRSKVANELIGGELPGSPIRTIILEPRGQRLPRCSVLHAASGSEWTHPELRPANLSPTTQWNG
jgi:hypothetical protein